MSSNGRRDVTVRAPIALASATGGVPLSAAELAAAQGVQLDPRDMLSAQQAEIRELRRELAIQMETAGKFANLVACLTAKLLAVQGRENPADFAVVVEQSLALRFDGVKVALTHTSGGDIKVQITERMN